MTRERVAIRPAHADDAESLALFVNALFQEQLPVLYQRALRLTADDERSFLARAESDPGNAIFVALAGERIVGMLDFHRHEEPQRSHAGVFGMSVAREERGAGVGRQLMHALLEWVERERRVNRIELQVFSNNQGAVRLYESCGFTHEGRKIGAVRVSGAYMDLLEMARVWPFEPHFTE